METQADWDAYFMGRALAEARRAYDLQEVPIGAVVVAERSIIGKGYNQVERLQDATAHAEMLALTAAMETLGSKYLPECSLYVTIEPCVMCAGASRWAQVRRLVFGAPEEKVGYARLGAGVLHPKTEVVSGVMAQEARQLMQAFFRERRG